MNALAIKQFVRPLPLFVRMIGLCFLPYLFLEGFELGVRVLVLVIIGRPEFPATIDLSVQRGATLVLGGVLYGISRVAAYHPALNPKYSTWLSLTPWTSRQPLPLGQVSFVLQDLLVMVSLAWLAHLRTPIHPAYPVVAMLVAYSVTMLSVLLKTGCRAEALVILWLLPLLVHFRNLPAVDLVAGIVIWKVADIGLARGLAAFPWGRDTKPKKERIGSTFEMLSPVEPSKPFGKGAGVFIGALVGWYAFSILSLLRDEDGLRASDAYLMAALFIGMAGLIRFVAYIAGRNPPISLWGRIWTGNFIIPGYDVMCIGPLATVAGGVVAMLLASALTENSPLIAAAGIAASLAIAIEAGPSIRNWHLTGHHRMVGSKRRSH